jgi:hypothetical protein
MRAAQNPKHVVLRQSDAVTFAKAFHPLIENAGRYQYAQ